MSETTGYKNLFDLTGRKAIVTGGSRGIGGGISRALAAHGADVAIVVRSSLALAHALADELNAGGGDSFAIMADVANESDVERMVAMVAERWGRVDILINNAGIVVPGNAEEFSLSSWRQTMSVNLDGVFLCCQAAGRMMIEQKKGVIVNIGSMSGRIVNWPFRHAAYNVSKAGVHMLTKCLATEWAEHGIRVNAVAPGYILTELAEDVIREHPAVVAEHWAKGSVQGRIGSVQEVVGSIIYLVSDSASFTTGEIITVDGGLTLR